ncbi:MAG TPA: SufD family Fe-S cluster assembly protein [Acholeplasmataceae bacterium]|nr:SufD family Fe-S cluster assembly protein [Acholeplasmataceae bacterium]
MKDIIIQDHKVQTKLPKDFRFENQQLIIPPHIHFEDPIKITIQDDNNESLDIVVSENTSIKIILELASEELTPHQYKLNLTAKKNAHVKYLLVSELSSKKALVEHYFTAARDAKLDLIGGFVSDIIDAKMHVELQGQGAEVNMRAVAVSSDENKQNIDVLIIHQAPNTIGNMTNIGIANKKGKIVLNGVEKIEKGMKQANAFQTLKGIITSDQAIVEVNPILLIDEFDVKAGHGATIGKIEEDQLYYLMSRGLNQRESEKLIINGFLKPIIDEIDDEPLKERFIHLVNSRI